MYIPVVLKNGYTELVQKDEFHFLMETRQVVLFKRSEGWTIVGKDPLRDISKRKIFTIPERRSAHLGKDFTP